MIAIEPDEFVAGAFTVSVDGHLQSHVNLDDPADLFFDYVRRMGAVLDVVADPGRPLTAVHLGAGGLTLPRYLQATRPGSGQYVLEHRPGLVAEVLARLPLPAGARVTSITGDAGSAPALLPAAVVGAADVVVSDTYSGSPTAARLRSPGYYGSLRSLLGSEGVLLVNVPVDGDLGPAREQAAILDDAGFGSVALLTASDVLADGEGNVVLAASPSPGMLAGDRLERLRAAGPHPAAVLAGEELRAWVRPS
ncbi:spermidine synthase [Microbacteriaceae bacterium 4G12]